MCDEEKQQILMFEKLDLGNIQDFCLKNDSINRLSKQLIHFLSVVFCIKGQHTPGMYKLKNWRWQHLDVDSESQRQCVGSRALLDSDYSQIVSSLPHWRGRMFTVIQFKHFNLNVTICATLYRKCSENVRTPLECLYNLLCWTFWYQCSLNLPEFYTKTEVLLL